MAFLFICQIIQAKMDFVLLSIVLVASFAEPVLAQGCAEGYKAQGLVDLTLESNANGSDVVRAVLSKIGDCSPLSRSVLVFMRRMAYVETKDGKEMNLGGIWNVSNEIFQEIRAQRMYLESVYDTIDACFNINWTKVKFIDLNKPLYSGLAVQLRITYLELQRITFVPRQIQDMYWSMYFHDNLSPRNKWRSAVSRIERLENQACGVQADVVFVLDTSSSIRDMNFDRVRNFTYDFADALLQMSDNNIANRIGVILFSRNATVEIPLPNSTLNQFNNKTELLKKIRHLEYSGGRTNTPDGLCQLAAQPWREGLVLRIGIILTDGMHNEISSNCGTLELAVNKVKNQSILRYVIGIGSGINVDELQLIATGPQFIDHVDTFFDLKESDVQDRAYYEFCFFGEPPLSAGNTTGNESLGQGQINKIKLRAPQDTNVTIRFCVMKGELRLYASTTVPNPSVAYNCWSTNIAAKKQSLTCFTQYFALRKVNSNREMRQTSNEATLYITIEGVDTINEYSYSSSLGYVIFDINECEQDSLPCSWFHLCVNTDGGYDCPVNYKLIIIIAAPSTAGLILCVFLMICICVCCKKQQSKHLKPNQANLPSSVSASVQNQIALKSKNDPNNEPKDHCGDQNAKGVVQWEYSKTKWYIKAE